MKAAPKYYDGFAAYVVVENLPIEQQVPLNKWLEGQTREVVEVEGDNKYNCCFYSDYIKWYDSWIKGTTAPNYD